VGAGDAVYETNAGEGHQTDGRERQPGEEPEGQGGGPEVDNGKDARAQEKAKQWQEDDAPRRVDVDAVGRDRTHAAIEIDVAPPASRADCGLHGHV